MPSLAENLWNRASFEFDDDAWSGKIAPRNGGRRLQGPGGEPQRTSIEELQVDSA
jgi:hypothetical protein